MMLTRIEDLVRNIAEKQGLSVTKVDITSGKKKGDGFLSDIHLVSATDAKGRRFDTAVKSAIEDQAIVDKFHIREVFENEEQFYSRVYPTLSRYQDEKQVSDPFCTVPRYYGSEFDGDIRFLVLENLRNKGFELFDKKAIVDGHHVEKVFTEYAKFHGVCYVYKSEHRQRFDEISGKLYDCWKFFMDQPSFKDIFKLVYKDVNEALEEAGAADLVQCFKKCENSVDMLVNIASYKGEYATLTHGDCWTNNFMFKYKQTDDGLKELTNIRVLDWQLIRMGTPVYDLSHFLYSSASKPVFDDLDYYLDVYYKSFSKMVRSLGHEPEDIYPSHILKAEWKKYSMFGFLLGLLMQRGKLTYDDEIVDMNDLKDAENEDEVMQKAFDAKYDRKVYMERVINLLRHMTEIGVL